MCIRDRDRIMKRFFALIIDLIIAQIIFSLFTFFMTPSPSVVGQLLYRLSAMMVFLVYNYITDREYNGVSIGKKILGIKTVIPADKKEIYCITHGLCNKSLFYLPELLS